MNMRALDLFCGAGGASMGLYRAGFDVIGIDLIAQPNYPFTFVRADALEPPFDLNKSFDFIWASPPCQAYSVASQTQRNIGVLYPDLISPVRALLIASGVPWVIENVPGAPIRGDISICGCQIGLKLRRRLYFETSWNEFDLSEPCQHDGPVVSVVGHGSPSWVRQSLGFNPSIHDYREAMGIYWMNRKELSLAVPPAYSEYIGRRAISAMRHRAEVSG